MADWLIKADVLDDLQNMQRLGLLPTREHLEALEGRDREVEALAGDSPRILVVAGTEAEIVVEGPLMRRRMGYFYFYDRGTTAYQEIDQALAVAEKDPSVKRVTLRINSPGGEVDGLFDTIAAIEAFSKPIVARVSNAESAAYALAAACDRIEATGPASMFGSIGIAARFSFRADQEIVEISNTKSPDKRPNVRTPEGKAVVQRHLDAINDLFVDAIARGRSAAGKKIRASEVNAAYGAGATFTAAEAKRRKMIDSIGRVGRPTTRPDPGTGPLEDDDMGAVVRRELVALGLVTQERVAEATQPDPEPAPEPETNDPAEASASGTEPAEGGREPEDMTTEANSKPMTLARLKAEHPEIFEAAKAEGVDAERDRVASHLVLGEAAGEDGMKIALAAVKDGKAMTGALQAEYMAAGMRVRDRATHQEDTDAAAAATAGAPAAAAANASKPEPDMGDKVADAMGLKAVEAAAN